MITKISLQLASYLPSRNPTFHCVYFSDDEWCIVGRCSVDARVTRFSDGWNVRPDVVKDIEPVQTRHPSRQGKSGQLIVAEVERGQTSQSLQKSKVRQSIAGENKRCQTSQAYWQRQTGQLIANQVERAQACQPIREGQAGQLILAEVERG